MVTVKANAKINLTLDILGVRPDGYHEVEMVMQSVGLFDTIHLARQREGISLRIDVPDLPTDERNLAWIAARLFLEEQNIHSGATIEIEKRIPVAAGLAGGSADAAGVLIGLNRLYETGLSIKELCAMGVEIGSDVPFCIEGGTMFATGRGELLRRLPDLPQLFVVLAKPPIGVLTAWAYRTYDEVGAVRHPDTPAMIAAISEGNVEKVAKGLVNVLEEVTMPVYSVIGDYKRVLEENDVMASLMSGSGPTVFALLRTKMDAERTAMAFSHVYPNTAVFTVPTTGQNEI